MTHAARLIAAFLLAGLALVGLPEVVWAENTPWRADSSVNRARDQIQISAASLHEDGTTVILGCIQGSPRSELYAGLSLKSGDVFLDGKVAVSWRIDEGPAQDVVWDARTENGISAAVALGQNAHELALAVANAKNQIVFRSPSGTVVFDATGSTEAISNLLLWCAFAD